MRAVRTQHITATMQNTTRVRGCEVAPLLVDVFQLCLLPGAVAIEDALGGVANRETFDSSNLRLGLRLVHR